MAAKFVRWWGPHLALTPSHMQPKFGRIRHELGRTDTKFGRFRHEFDPSSAQLLANPSTVVRTRTKHGRTRAKSGPFFGRLWPLSKGSFWLEFNPSGPSFGQMLPASPTLFGHSGLRSAKFGSDSASDLPQLDVVRTRGRVCRDTWQTFGGRTRTKFGLVFAALDSRDGGVVRNDVRGSDPLGPLWTSIGGSPGAPEVRLPR